jgi:hypothetical protein
MLLALLARTGERCRSFGFLALIGGISLAHILVMSMQAWLVWAVP